MKTFLLVAFVLACLLDYFLFTTGNVSVLCILFAGFAMVPLTLAGAAFLYVIVDLKAAGKGHIASLVAIAVLGTSASFYAFSNLALEHARFGIEDEARRFMAHPEDATFLVNARDIQLMQETKNSGFVVCFDGFTPVFRRGDFVIFTNQGQKLRLVVSMSAFNKPQVSLRTIDTAELIDISRFPTNVCHRPT